MTDCWLLFAVRWAWWWLKGRVDNNVTSVINNKTSQRVGRHAMITVSKQTGVLYTSLSTGSF